jgi:hypothetical protein
MGWSPEYDLSCGADHLAQNDPICMPDRRTVEIGSAMPNGGSRVPANSTAATVCDGRPMGESVSWPEVIVRDAFAGAAGGHHRLAGISALRHRSAQCVKRWRPEHGQADLATDRIPSL